MDFKNYTLGRLVPDRGNYDFDNPEYHKVYLQILQRIKDIGYSSKVFGDADREIAEIQQFSRARDGNKTDRYGKKYSWIAFFEMYGVRKDQGKLEGQRIIERSSDCDIDPSFPSQPLEWMPTLPKIFTKAPRGGEAWLRSGIVPNYRHLLVRNSVDDARGGPWILLDGYIGQDGSYDRRVFTFIRGLFIYKDNLESLKRRVEESSYLGNQKIPEPFEDYYTFAGEIPWSQYFAAVLRRADGKAKRHIDKAFGRYLRKRLIGIPVEVPVHRWIWESYHSSLNQVSGVTFPEPSICKALGLVNHNDSFDLYDSNDRLATIYREFKLGREFFTSHFLYIRANLLKQYLMLTQQVLVWVPWGERTLHWKRFEPQQLPRGASEALAEHANTFGELIVWSA